MYSNVVFRICVNIVCLYQEWKNGIQVTAKSLKCALGKNNLNVFNTRVGTYLPAHPC